MGDLVPGVADGQDRVRVPLGGIAEDEERGPDPAPGQQAEDPGQAGPGPEALVGHQ